MTQILDNGAIIFEIEMNIDELYEDFKREKQWKTIIDRDEIVGGMKSKDVEIINYLSHIFDTVSEKIKLEASSETSALIIKCSDVALFGDHFEDKK